MKLVIALASVCALVVALAPIVATIGDAVSRIVAVLSIGG